jgi:small subunit ribosomal protein S20
MVWDEATRTRHFQLDLVKDFIYRYALKHTEKGGFRLATHKSAEKRATQNVQRSIRNASLRSSIKTSIKAVVASVGTKNKEEATQSLQNAIPAIARAAARGAFHKKTASRRIARLTKKVNALT